eukprot:m.207386 g.207386  ORF g.207386 m.207386 type:complete len:126 (-) comp53908_c0_seq63:1013-1390(-)
MDALLSTALQSQSFRNPRMLSDSRRHLQCTHRGKSRYSDWCSTSLMVAASTASTACVAVLLAHGADRTLRDSKSKTALVEIARQEGHQDVVKLLEVVALAKLPPSRVVAAKATAFDQVPVESWDD